MPSDGKKCSRQSAGAFVITGNIAAELDAVEESVAIKFSSYVMSVGGTSF